MTTKDERNQNHEPSLHLPIRKFQMIHGDSLTVHRILFQSEKHVYAGEENADNEVVV